MAVPRLNISVSEIRRVALTLALGLGVVVVLALVSGCAVGMRENPDGTKSLVAGIALDDWSGGQVGKAVGGILGVLGVPGATAIGTGVTGALGLLGWGGVKVAKSAANARAEAARLAGEAAGWEQREHAAAIQLPLPPAGGAGAVVNQPAPE